jgi:putative cell wall-binding protein
VRRTAAGVLAGALALSGAVATALPANAAVGFGFDRLAGNDRYETSAAISARYRGVAGATASTNVILASGESGRTPDALAASFLAGVQNAPVLVTRRDTTPEPILTELRALRTAGATTLTIVGGPAAVSEQQLTTLRGLGFTTINRVAGADRYQTARAIVAAGESAAASNVGLVASGVSTIDALAGGPLAYKGKHPLFLVTRDGIPGATLAAMRESGVTSVYILGGEAVVGPRVVAQLATAGVTVTGRLAGADRSATSVAIAEALVANFGFDRSTFNLASGANEGIDALSGAALSGRENRAILISNTANSAAPVVAFATRNAATLNAIGHIFGGEAAITATLQAAVTTAGGGTGAGTAGITLAGTSAVAGSTFTGTLANPGTVQSVSVTGCGFNNQAVTIGAGGGFSLSLPAAQTVGACPLAFTVLRTDGSSSTQTVNFTVTAPPSSVTAAPDLLSAAVNASTGVVTYTFDQAVTGAIAAPANFYVYNAAGVRTPSTGPVSASGSTVIAQFPTAVANAATLAAISTGAVADAAGRLSYAASAPLGVQAQTAGRTVGPDLESVSNLRTENGRIVADFRFDEPVARDGLTLTGGNVSRFQLIASDGTTFTGGPVTAISADVRTVTVAFETTAQVPIGSIVRGVALAGAVVGSNAAPGNIANVAQTEPRTGATGSTAFLTGVVADRTDDPDLTAVAVAGTDVVTFTFDEAVQANPVGGVVANPGSFYVYDAAGTARFGTAAVRTSGNTSVVNVTFDAGVVGAAVGAGVAAGAVQAVDDAQTNQTHELQLQNVSNTAGRTALPDLVSVSVSTNAFGVNTVVYTFDQAVSVAAAATLTGAQFGLVDANGTRFSPAGLLALEPSGTAGTAQGEFNSGRTTVTFTGTGGFTNAQAAAAVIGNVEDLTAANDAAGTDVTTGDVPVQR